MEARPAPGDCRKCYRAAHSPGFAGAQRCRAGTGGASSLCRSKLSAVIGHLHKVPYGTTDVAPSGLGMESFDGRRSWFACRRMGVRLSGARRGGDISSGFRTLALTVELCLFKPHRGRITRDRYSCWSQQREVELRIESDDETHARFAALLDEDPLEGVVHQFLADHSSVLARWSGWSSTSLEIVSKPDLHSLIPDFAIGQWQPTTSRHEWMLVELERPGHRLFTLAGNPTKELSHAIRQITDWRSWIQENLHYARTILPDIIPLCPVAVVIGRRRQVDSKHGDRLAMLQIQSPGVRITTYDSLLDAAMPPKGLQV